MKFQGQIEVVRQGKRKVLREPRKPVGPRIPRISRLMALAIKMQAMVDRREVKDYAELARLAQVTRARITQIMNLNLLSPELQEWLLFLEEVENGRSSVKLASLQFGARIVNWNEQSDHSSRMGYLPHKKSYNTCLSIDRVNNTIRSNP